MVSNSGGATAWPTIATRVALISSPALTPPASATALQFNFNFRQQLRDGKFLQILRVEPFEFRPVEHGVGAAHALERKLLEQIFGAQEFFVATGRPAQQREKIAERFRKKSFGAV